MPGGRPTQYDPAHCYLAEATLSEACSQAVLAGRLGPRPYTGLAPENGPP